MPRTGLTGLSGGNRFNTKEEANKPPDPEIQLRGLKDQVEELLDFVDSEIISGRDGRYLDSIVSAKRNVDDSLSGVLAMLSARRDHANQ